MEYPPLTYSCSKDTRVLLLCTYAATRTGLNIVGGGAAIASLRPEPRGFLMAVLSRGDDHCSPPVCCWLLLSS